MLPCNLGGHTAYQDTFVSEFLKYYPNPFILPKDTWDYIIQFWYLDLSLTDSLMQECYSVFGPQPRLPSCMLRSYLLALKLKVTSITVWCRMLCETPLYAIFSGFSVGDIPGVGTFYDFFTRLWKDASGNISPKDRFPKMKPPKGKKKGDKTSCDSSGIASRLLPLLDRWDLKPGNPFRLIFKLYNQQLLSRSVEHGLIDPSIFPLPMTELLSVLLHSSGKSGSATAGRMAVLPVAVNAITLNQTAAGGWDSHRKCYFFGYHLYMYVASDSHSDLPVFPLLERASRHDMLSFLHSFFTLKTYLPQFHIEKLRLDSAHDAYPVYDYGKRKNISPFIDLNLGHTGHFTYKDDFTIDDNGVPVCRMGLHMQKDGYETAKHRAKFRCPKVNRKQGCFCGQPCSPAKYGKTVHIFTSDNPRLFNIPPRGSKAWKKEYDGRTSVERSNKREKEDYKLEDGRHRSTKMWYCRLYGIMMLQHLDAWKIPSAEAFQNSLLRFKA